MAAVTHASAHRGAGTDANKLLPADRAVHDWYRFVLSYPPHLVRTYFHRFNLQAGQHVLDPFCGTGTTLVEARKHGIESSGLEFNPLPCFASRTKTDWDPDPEELLRHAAAVASAAYARLEASGIGDHPDRSRANGHTALLSLPPEQSALLLEHSISPLPLHKALVLRGCLDERPDDRLDAHLRLALARTLVLSSSNLHFGPEVGVGVPKPDAPVISPWLANVQTMADDLNELRDRRRVPGTVHCADARAVARVLTPRSIDVVITSPPYPNEKDYTRTTRLESVVLGFLATRDDLRALKKGLVRSNTRGVYKGDDDDANVATHPEIQRIASDIEERRLALGKTSGFERMYPRVTRLYFGGMLRHLRELQPALKPGAQLAYVVGDQASYLQVMIRTGQLLADLAESIGYEVIGIDLFRTRAATATRQQLREEVVLLRWPGRAV